MNEKRLIETAFPLREASAASLHEKNMRHGHISTLHLWPARRPLAACRAAIAAALLPDPGDDKERTRLVRRLGGELVRKKKGKTQDGDAVETDKIEAKGGILWWGHESSPDLAWFREGIRAAHGGRAPRVLDPFAGGGAIPLEAMRLGCEVVANDLSPVAWMILKCTLEYPQKLAGELLPLPNFAMRDRNIATAFLKSRGFKGKKLAGAVERMLSAGGIETAQTDWLSAEKPWEKADLSWHVKAWGNWVQREARKVLASRYPIYAEWQAIDRDVEVEPQPLLLLDPDQNGDVSAAFANREIPADALSDRTTPRWVAKPTAAYLWARTLQCPSCRVWFPLLKTFWLVQKDRKRALLDLQADKVNKKVDVNVVSGRELSAYLADAQPRRHSTESNLSRGTLSRSGAECPCCSYITNLEALRYESAAGRLSTRMTAVIVEGLDGKEYRNPEAHELAASALGNSEIDEVFSKLPFGRPAEMIPTGGSRSGGGTRFSTPPYGLTKWEHLFLARQLHSLGIFVKTVRSIQYILSALHYPSIWQQAIVAYLAMAIDRMADYGSTICSWNNKRETLRGTFARYAIPLVWDFTETCPISSSTGNFLGGIEWISKAISRNLEATANMPLPNVACQSATKSEGEFDAIITDPPYYDAIPYSDIMDFFYVWLRRSLWDLLPSFNDAFVNPHGPKWDHSAGDGELIDEASRFGGDKRASKQNFEDGMANVFKKFQACLKDSGIFVIVFANKNPDAWETLVSAAIRAGFVVEGSLPIQTERSSRPNALAAAALSSSVWLVCRKRPTNAQPGWSGPVLEQMRENITTQMRRFWDAGIRGPDFLWAATGPALEAFSRHPVVWREATPDGKRHPLPVAEFLREARRLVVEFAVGRVLRPDTEAGTDAAGLDDATTYYLLHRDSFGMNEAPVGACILYAISCGLSDQALIDQYELLLRAGGDGATSDEGEDEPEEDADPDETDTEPEIEGTGSKVRLRRWDQRHRKALGLDGPGGHAVPLIDRLHRLMRLWKAGDVTKVDAYIVQTGLGRDALFAEVMQAVTELSRRENNVAETVMLETISNHLHGRAGISPARQAELL